MCWRAYDLNKQSHGSGHLDLGYLKYQPLVFLKILSLKEWLSTIPIYSAHCLEMQPCIDCVIWSPLLQVMDNVLAVVVTNSLPREHSVHALSQWETTLHCNIVSHWLGAYTKSSLIAWTDAASMFEIQTQINSWVDKPSLISKQGTDQHQTF